MERPKFVSIFSQKSEFCEVTDEKPVDSFIPGQALDLKELVSRFERGQRLNVHNNFAPGSNFYQASDEQAAADLQNETFDDCPPIGVYDVADVEQLKREHEVHKREFISRKKKEAESKQAEPAKAPQDPAPKDPD